MGRKLKYTQADVDKLFQLRLSGYNVRKIAEIIQTVSYSTLIKVWNELATPEQKELANAAEAQLRRSMADKNKIANPADDVFRQQSSPLIPSDAVSLHAEALHRMSESLAPLASIAQSLERIVVALEERPLVHPAVPISTNGNVTTHPLFSSNGSPDIVELTDMQKCKIREHLNDGVCIDDISDMMGIPVELVTMFAEDFNLIDSYESVIRDNSEWE